MFSLLGDAVNAVTSTVDDVIGLPIAKTVARPVTCSLDILDGLTEFEIREKAILELGVEVAAMYTTSELITLLIE